MPTLGQTKWIDHLGTICSAIFLTVSPAQQHEHHPMFTLPSWMPRQGPGVLPTAIPRTVVYERRDASTIIPSPCWLKDWRMPRITWSSGNNFPLSSAPFMPYCCIMIQTSNNFSTTLLSNLIQSLDQIQTNWINSNIWCILCVKISMYVTVYICTYICIHIHI